MMEIPFALAFTAGLVATVNPCGFAMLPAYLSYFVGVEGGRAEASGAGLVGRALYVGAVVSAGFLVVFGVAGVLITVALQAVVSALPWAAMVVGIGVVLLGFALLLGWELTASLPKVGGQQRGKGAGGLFLFGVSYAVASLSCTLPIFLTVVVGTISRGSLVAGVGTFLVYGLGMSMLLLVVTLAIALGQRGLIGWMRRSSKYVSRVSGAVLILAGGWIVFFWATNLRAGPLGQGDLIIFMERVSAFATNTLADRAELLGLGFGGLIAAAALYAWWARPRAADPAELGDEATSDEDVVDEDVVDEDVTT